MQFPGGRFFREQIAEIAGHRQRVGEESELESLGAGAELGRSHAAAARSPREKSIVRERLSLLLGWPVDDTRIAARTEAMRPERMPALADLEVRALAVRPVRSGPSHRGRRRDKARPKNSGPQPHFTRTMPSM